MSRQRHNCPHPRKHAYRTWEEADDALGYCWQNMRRKTMPIRAYKCTCGRFHLTHQPQRVSTGGTL